MKEHKKRKRHAATEENKRRTYKMLNSKETAYFKGRAELSKKDGRRLKHKRKKLNVLCMGKEFTENKKRLLSKIVEAKTRQWKRWGTKKISFYLQKTSRYI